MQPLTQVPYEHLNPNLVRLRVPLGRNSLYRAILLAANPLYQQGYGSGQVIDIYQLADDLARLTSPDQIPGLIGHNIYLVSPRLRLITKYKTNSPTSLVILALDHHYEPLASYQDQLINPILTTVDFIKGLND